MIDDENDFKAWFRRATRNWWLSLLLVAAGSLTAEAAPFAYVTNSNSGDVSVIDTATQTVVATVPVGAAPRGVAVTPDGAFAYVANFGSGSVSVIDTAARTLVATVPMPVGSYPWGVAITPNGAFAYVTNFGSNSVSVIDTASNTVVTTVQVGGDPWGVAITPSGAFAYVASAGLFNVSVLDTATNIVVATVPLCSYPNRGCSYPHGVAIAPDGSYLLVAAAGGWFSCDERFGLEPYSCYTDWSASAINTATNTAYDANWLTSCTYHYNGNDIFLWYSCNPPNVQNQFLAPELTSVAFTPNAAFAYMTDTLSNYVWVLGTTTTTIPVGQGPQGVAITPDGAFAYVANWTSGSVSVIDTAINAVVATIPVGPTPFGVAITPF
jgi:YVTN family beta-propeller protein